MTTRAVRRFGALVAEHPRIAPATLGWFGPARRSAPLETAIVVIEHIQ